MRIQRLLWHGVDNVAAVRISSRLLPQARTGSRAASVPTVDRLSWRRLSSTEAVGGAESERQRELRKTAESETLRNSNGDSLSGIGSGGGAVSGFSGGGVVATASLGADAGPAAKPSVGTGNASKIDPRVWPIAVSALLMGTGIGVVVPVMPLFANSIGISATELGAVVGVMGATRLLMNIPSAVFAERYGRKPLLVGGPLVTALGMGFTGTATSFAELCGWRFFVGAGGSLQMSGAQMYLADISTTANRARSMAPMTIAFSAGSLVGPAVGGLLAHTYGLHAPFLFVGAAVIGVALNNMRLPETRPVSSLASNQRRTIREEFVHTAAMWRPLVRNTNVQSCVLVHGGYWVVASGCQFALMPILAAQKFGLTPSSIGLCFAAMASVNLLGAQPAAWASDKFGRKAIVMPATSMIAVGVAAIPFTTSVEAFVASLMLWAGGATFLGSTPTAYLADVTTDEERPHGLALLRSAGDVGLMVGASMLGFIADVTGAVDSAFLAAAAITLAYGAQFAIRATESVSPASLEEQNAGVSESR